MSLPKLNVSVYEAKLPSTNKVIKFRPFLVKEEKILLTALEDGEQSSMMVAVKNIIKNCVQGKIEVDKLPIFDIEYIFHYKLIKLEKEFDKIYFYQNVIHNYISLIKLDAIINKTTIIKPREKPRQLWLDTLKNVIKQIPNIIVLEDEWILTDKQLNYILNNIIEYFKSFHKNNQLLNQAHVNMVFLKKLY